MSLARLLLILSILLNVYLSLELARIRTRPSLDRLCVSRIVDDHVHVVSGQ